MEHVNIYYSPVCGLCTKAIDFLRERGVTFTAYVVEWDEQADEFVDSDNVRAMMLRCGEIVDFVPQIFIGNRHIRGWRSLEPMIESGEIDTFLEECG